MTSHVLEAKKDVKEKNKEGIPYEAGVVANFLISKLSLAYCVIMRCK